MRVIDHECDLLFTARPFADGVGASLYVGVSNPDAGPTSIVHRRNRGLIAGEISLSHLREQYDFGADSIPKTPRIAVVEAPEADFAITIPESWHGQSVWLQVRTFADDLENETIYRPRRLVIDDEGGITPAIGGTAVVTAIEKRDGGGVLVRFQFQLAREAVPPALFLLRKITGVGTIAPGSTEYVDRFTAVDLPQRTYEIECSGLTNAQVYTFDLIATTGSAEATLVSGIPFTADAAGPPAVTNARAVEM